MNEFDSKLTRAANILGGYYERSKDHHYDAGTISFHKGHALWCVRMSGANRGRVKFSSSLPYEANSLLWRATTAPTPITVALSRPATRIADDIERRILAGAEHEYDQYLRALASHQSDEQRFSSNRQRLEQAVRRIEFYQYLASSSGVRGSIRGGQTPYTTFYLKPNGFDKIELQSLPYNLGLEILKLVDAHYEAGRGGRP